VLGIQRTAPGWEKVTIAPNPCGLARARGTVPLPEQGRIDVSWTADEAQKRITIKVKHPKHVEVNVVVPEGYEGVIAIANI
jgi:alpha-L-rhamnosidase